MHIDRYIDIRICIYVFTLFCLQGAQRTGWRADAPRRRRSRVGRPVDVQTGATATVLGTIITALLLLLLLLPLIILSIEDITSRWFYFTNCLGLTLTRLGRPVDVQTGATAAVLGTILIIYYYYYYQY